METPDVQAQAAQAQAARALADGLALPGLDHALVAVRDLEAAATAWGRLGFAVTPYGRHDSWGTANRCLMFEQDYLELIGIVDPAKPSNGVDRFLARRGEGALGLCLATDDPAAAHRRLEGAGIAGGAPQALSRALEMPDGSVRPRFSLLHPIPDAPTGVPWFVCRHETPELMRRPDWLAHANTARRLRIATAAVADPSALAPLYAALFGADAVIESRRGLTVRFGDRPDALLLHFGRSLDGIEGLLGLAVEVADLDRAEALLRANGIHHIAAADGLHVAPAAATGVALSFLRG